MANFSTAKKECKCHVCGATIKAGDKAKWVQVIKGGFGQSSGLSYNYTRWRMECLEGCDSRLGQQYTKAQDAQEQKQAQETVNMLRTIVCAPQEQIEGMIAHFAKKGIIVV